jgi:2-C-methyl-D-erythritol 4-phosphate cytidylyltransferase
MQVFAILPAAGLGTRMAGPQPKQFLSLDGVPILIHSLRAFASVERITAIYVAVRKPEIERVEAQIAEYGIFAGRVKRGRRRRQPPGVGLPRAGRSCRRARRHRPGPRRRAPADRRRHHRPHHRRGRRIGAAIVGLPAVDTIKQVERTAHGALVTSTIPREFVVLAQTPQGFRFESAAAAFAEATADGFVGTDEASVVERAGLPVAVVHGSQVNLKITQAGDLELAEFYLRQRPAERLSSITARLREDDRAQRSSTLQTSGPDQPEMLSKRTGKEIRIWIHASDLVGIRTHSSPECRCASAD